MTLFVGGISCCSTTPFAANNAKMYSFEFEMMAMKSVVRVHANVLVAYVAVNPSMLPLLMAAKQ